MALLSGLVLMIAGKRLLPKPPKAQGVHGAPFEKLGQCAFDAACCFAFAVSIFTRFGGSGSTMVSR